MHPYITEAVARERIADMQAVAAAHRLAREAAGTRTQSRRGHRLVLGRRHDSIELVWPDGVSSVVELPRQPEPTHSRGRGLAGSRR